MIGEAFAERSLSLSVLDRSVEAALQAAA